MTALSITTVKGKMTRNLSSCSAPRCGRSGTNRVSLLGYPFDEKAGLFCNHHAKQLRQTWESAVPEKAGSAVD
jgi:hypothetical protein